jgi:hypothetical protein
VSASKQKGTAWETAIVRYLHEVGVPHAERRALNGTKDRGDIAGIPGVVIEAKNERALSLAEWVREAEGECHNAGASVGAVWHKRRGFPYPADGYVTMTGAQFVNLLRDAGYIREVPSGP